MLSSVDLNLERALFLAVLILFSGAGFSCTLIIFMINSIRKKHKNGWYYIFLFLVSGIIALILAASYFYITLERAGFNT
ncbi:hypothetical protein [Chryseobacterium indologenes]|uniref:Uncharacterized protein n=1 Tax=Chryseobacterium indologenes TaxID=253 RepID=A0A0N0IUG0_CHRID|nr:hypothetical protein [Chryseobacterium indologenes]KPE49613.1 hypothetical protein AOB46_19020 [Chryseobacterium indologenes]